MKRIASLATVLVAAACALSLSACGSSSVSTQEPPAVEKAKDGTLTASSDNIAVVMGETTLCQPFDIDELAEAGLFLREGDAEAQIEPGGHFTPTLGIDEDFSYCITPTYENPGSSVLSVGKAKASTVGIGTWVDKPVDQDVSLFGVKFGMTSAEVTELLGEASYSKGATMQWKVDFSDDESSEAFLTVDMTAKGKKGVVRSVILTVVPQE